MKLPVAVIGPGRIGCDLLVKITKSKYLECILFSGQREDSPGIAFAKGLNVPTSTKSIQAILDSKAVVVFDATSAEAHKQNKKFLHDRFVIDMTPSHLGHACIPVLNLQESLTKKEVNMISCGGQANIPIIKVLKDTYPEIDYAELVSVVAAKSAGIGTRDNIDQYVQTTQDVVKEFVDIKKTKAILIITPADPPIQMHNTIYAKVENPNLKLLKKRLKELEKKIKEYVPGYKITRITTIDNKLIVMNEVTGRGDYLPPYAGNLDVINSAAVKVAEEFAKTHPMEVLS